MKMKRFLALVLAFCLVLGMVPAPVYAEETTGEQVSNETTVETTAAAEPQAETTAPVETETPADAADIVLSTTNVTGYEGQTIYVPYTVVPEGATVNTSVASDNNEVADYRGGSSSNAVGVGMNKAGSAIFTITVGDKIYTLNVEVKETPDLTINGDKVTVNLDPGATYGFNFTGQPGTYMICWDKAAENITVSGTGFSSSEFADIADYNRKKLTVINTDQLVTVVMTNNGAEAQTFDLYLGETVAAGANDLTITGPTEVEVGQTMELAISMPMFASVDYINWSVDDSSIAEIYNQDKYYCSLRANNAGTVIVTAGSDSTDTASFTLTVKAPEVTGFFVDSVTMVQGVDTSDLTFDDDSTVYKVYDPATKNPTVTINYSDGTTRTYYWNDVEANTGLKMGHYNDLKTTADWGVGNHTWTVMLVDDQNGILATYDMTITLEESPIQSVTAGQATLTEGLHVIIATGTPDGNVPFYDMGMYGQNTELTLTYSNGSVVTSTWLDLYNVTGCYHVESISSWEDSRYWIPGNSYTWTVAIKDDQGKTYATCDIPVYVEKLDRQTLTLDTATTVSLNAYQHKILEFDATESGYLWLWTEGTSFEVINRILDADFERIYGDPHNSGNKYGTYVPVTAGEHYDIYVYSPSEVSNSITATMMPEATGIQLETTEVVGYVGQQIVWVDFTCIPDGSLAQLDFNNVIVDDEDIVLCRTGSSTIGIEMLKAGSTTIDITVGENTYTINVTVKEPVALADGDIVKQLTLAPGESYAFSVTPDESIDYIVAYDKEAKYISASFSNYSIGGMPETAEFHRFKMNGLSQGNTYTCVLRNDGTESATFDLYLGKAVEPAQGDLTITGPTEVEYGEEIKLYIDMPMFVDISWVNWSHDNNDIAYSYSMDSWFYFLSTSGAGTVVITAGNNDVTATHTVTIKAYGSDAIQSWIAPGDGSNMTMTFSPTEDGWYWLNYCDREYVDFIGMGPVGTGEQPLAQESYNKGSGSGMIYKLEAGKTYTFEAYEVYSSHTFFMNKLDVATDVTVTPAITGKVHEQSQLNVEYTGMCSWEVESSNENIVMTGGSGSNHVEVFLLSEGTATLTVTDQDGNQYICNVTVSGELGTETLGSDGWDEMGLAAGDSQTYNFTAYSTGLYWIHSELGHDLGITVEQNGVALTEEYVFNKNDGNDRRGKIYSFVDGQTYQITFTSDHNMTTFINVDTVHEANYMECWRSDLEGTEGETDEVWYSLIYQDDNGYRYDGVGQVKVTSTDENVVRGVSADGSHAVIEYVGEGSATITIEVNGVALYSLPVTVNPALKAISFTVENVTLYERMDTSKLTYDDGRTYMVYDAGSANPHVTFELSNGLTFEGTWHEVRGCFNLRMGHYELLENTASWGVGDHQWVVDLSDENGKILGTCEITVTILELPSTRLTLDQETAVTLGEGEGTGLRVTPDQDGYLCLWANDRNADFEMMGAMDSAGLRCEVSWLYNDETGERGVYIAVSEGATYEFFVKASNGAGTANFTPTVLPATTDITLETTEVVGYPGQNPLVKFESTPALSIIDGLDCTANTNAAVADWNGYSQNAKELYFNLKSVGVTTITLKLGENTYDVKITVKEPPVIGLDTPVSGSLAAGEGIVYVFTPEETGNYMICVNNGIDIDSENGWQFDCGTAEYNRKFLGDLQANTAYYIPINNYGEEAKNYELSIGKAEIATGMSIAGETEMIAGNGYSQALELNYSPKYGYLEEMMGWGEYITWESDNPDVAWVNFYDNRSAYIVAENPGTATITATSTSGLSATFTITVKDYKDSVDAYWTGNDGELNFSFIPEEDGYYHLHWRDLWGSEPMLAEGEKPLFSFDYGWSWSNGFIYQMEANKTYNFFCEWANSDAQIYMKKVDMATSYQVDASLSGKVHEQLWLNILADNIPYWEVESSDESIVMTGGFSSDGINVFLLGEGTATLTVTDHLGGVHKCTVTVSGELGTEDMEIVEWENKGWDEMGLAAGDSQTYNFTPWASGLYWINSELGHDLGIKVELNGTEIPAAYDFDLERENEKCGAVYMLDANTTYQITFESDHNMTTFVNAECCFEANRMDVYCGEQLDYLVGDWRHIEYELRYVNDDEQINTAAVGNLTVTSSNENVVKVESYDGGVAKIVAVGEGTATVTFKLNGEIMHQVTVNVTKPLILTLGEKLDVAYGETYVQMIAMFTPEKTGYYAIYMDTPVRGTLAVMGFWGNDVVSGVNYNCFLLEAGETYEIVSWLNEPAESMSAQLWVEEADYVTNLEIIDEPVKKTYFVGSLDSGIDLEGLKLKVTWSDTSTSSYTLEQLMQTNGKIGGHGINVETVEGEDGKTGIVTISCCEGSDTYDVTLEENPVASIEVVGELKIPENTYGESNGDFWFYSPDFIRDALKLKVNYKDGTSVEIPATQTQLNGYLIYQDVEYAQNYQPWTKDSTNTIHFQYMGHEATAEVQIVDNWIESIEVSGTPTTEFRFGNGKYGWMENDIYYFVPANYGKLEGLSFKVTRTNGEIMEFSAADLTWIYGDEYSENSFGWYDGLPVEVYVEGFNYNAYNQVHAVTEPGAVTMTVRYGWKTDTYTINLLAKEEVHVHEITEVEANAATYEQTGNIQYWYCESCHAIFGDDEGNTTLTEIDVIIPKLVKVEVQKTELNQQIDEVLNGISGEETVKEVVVQVQDSSPENSVVSVALPTSSVQKIVDANSQPEATQQTALTVELNTATVTLDSKALETITEAAGDSREITLVVEQIETTDLTQAQQSAVEEHDVEMVISAEILGTDGVISETFGGGTATVQIPFTPAEGTSGSDYKILYVADNGETEIIETTYAGGCLVFKLEHFSEYVVVKDEKPVISGEIIDTGRTLSLEGVIYINQYIKVTGFEGVDIETKGGLLVWDHAVTEEEAVYGTQTDLNAGLIKVGSEYAQRTDGIFARKYADVYYLRVYIQLDDGSYVYGPVKEYSVKKYCENKLNSAKTSAELKAMCAAMLHYGTAAQVYSNDYKPYGYANANILSSYPATAWDAGLLTPVSAVPAGSVAATGDVSSNGKSLSLTGAICVNYYFGTSFAGEIKTAELLVWTGVEGALTTENVSYSVALKQIGNEYAAQSEGIYTRKYGETIFACAHFVDADGNHHYSSISAYSLEQYATNKLNNPNTSDALREVCERMVIFGEYAKAYFTSIGK